MDRTRGQNVQTEAAKDRLARLQAALVRIEIDEKRAILIPPDKIEPAWSAMAAKNFLRAEAPRLAQLLDTTEGVDAKRDLLTETHDEFLRRLSLYDPGDDFHADPQDKKVKKFAPPPKMMVAQWVERYPSSEMSELSVR